VNALIRRGSGGRCSAINSNGVVELAHVIHEGELRDASAREAPRGFLLKPRKETALQLNGLHGRREAVEMVDRFAAELAVEAEGEKAKSLEPGGLVVLHNRVFGVGGGDDAFDVPDGNEVCLRFGV
jgi:hypothetical protein